MPDDNIPSQKYRNTGIPRYFVTSSAVDNFSANSKISKKDENIGKIYTLQAACAIELNLHCVPHL